MRIFAKINNFSNFLFYDRIQGMSAIVGAGSGFISAISIPLLVNLPELAWDYFYKSCMTEKKGAGLSISNESCGDQADSNALMTDAITTVALPLLLVPITAITTAFLVRTIRKCCRRCPSVRASTTHV